MFSPVIAFLLIALVVSALCTRAALARATAAEARASEADVRFREFDEEACCWEVLCLLRHPVRAYVQALVEYAETANGNEFNLLPRGYSYDEGQAVVVREQELLDAVRRMNDAPDSMSSLPWIGQHLEILLRMHTGGGYRHSPHRLLRESWCRLLDTLAYVDE